MNNPKKYYSFRLWITGMPPVKILDIPADNEKAASMAAHRKYIHDDVYRIQPLIRICDCGYNELEDFELKCIPCTLKEVK
jgi:hypothetical protein